MKRRISVITAAFLAAAALTACGGKTEETAAPTQAQTAAEESKETEAAESKEPAELKELVVGASPAPHAEILEAARPVLEEKGYSLKIVEYTDYVQPNLALDTGDLDANYFQHTPYLEQFNKEQGTHLVAVGKVHFEPMSIYAGTVKDLKDIPAGTKVGIPNDATNGGRALLLLEANGLIKLNPDAGVTATKLDITENPYNLEIVEMEAAQLPLSLSDLGFAAINSNYALQNKLTEDDTLATEDAESVAAKTYGNVVVVKEGNENLPGIAELMEVLHGQTVVDFINNTYGGAVAPLK